MSASIFYLGFILGAYPAMMLAQRFPIERVACIIVTLWGLCLILTTVCKDYRGIFAQRFFLGFLEAGISPMFMMIVVRYGCLTPRRYLPTKSLATTGKLVQKR